MLRARVRASNPRRAPRAECGGAGLRRRYRATTATPASAATVTAPLPAAAATSADTVLV